MKSTKFKKPIFLAIFTSICLVFISAQPVLAAGIGLNISYPSYDLNSGQNLFYSYMTNTSDGSLFLVESPVGQPRFRVTRTGDIHGYRICDEDGNESTCYNLSDSWSSGADGYIGDVQAHTAGNTLDMDGNAIYGHLLGAVSGTPDVTIWGVSGDNTNRGIFYNEGSPDYIEFKTGGTVTARIALDTGAADFGISGGNVSVGGELTVSGADIKTSASDLRLVPAGGGYVEAKSNSATYGLIIRDYNSDNWGNIDANDGYLAIGYNNANGPLFINDYDNIGINIAARTDGYKLSIGGPVHMNDSPINYASQLHFNPGLWLYDNDNNQYLNYRWGNAGAGGIIFYDGENVLQGYVYSENTDQHFGLLDGDGNWAIMVKRDDYTEFRVNNSGKMRITSTNVNIGTTNVSYKLTVNNKIGTPDSSNPYLVLDSSGAGSDTNEQSAQVSLGEHGRGSASLHLAYTGNGYSYIGMGSLGGDNIPDYYAMRMYYTNRDIYMPGNIGIGTLPNSSYKLYVVGGNARINGKLYVGANGIGTAYIDGLAGSVVAGPTLESYNGFWVRGGSGNGLYIENNGGADISGNVHVYDSVGIGTGPSSSHRIYANIAFAGWAYRFQNDNNGSNIHVAHGGGFGMSINAGSNASASVYALEVYNGTDVANRMRVMGDGKVGVKTASPSKTLHVIGHAKVSQHFSVNKFWVSYTAGLGSLCANNSGSVVGCYSDERLKENIKTIDRPIEKLKKLRGVYFNWKKDNEERYVFDGRREIGLIAQEVEKVLPEVVGENTDGYKSMNYSKLTSFLVEVNKKQEELIDELTREIERLETH